MKKIDRRIRSMWKAVFFIVCGGMNITSCVDMDLSPNGSPSDSNVWSTASLAEQTVAGVYNQLYVEYSDVANGWFDIWSSSMDYGIGIAPTFNFLFGTNSSSSEKGSLVQWQRNYKGIIKANDVIANITKVEGLDEDKKSRYVSECIFLRSWWYYRLNILYGGVPYYRDPIKDIDEAVLARSTQDEVWQYIVEDLTQCINNPDLPNKYSAGDSDYGHITKGAAYALRGKVYLWMKEWQKAAADFQAVKDCGYSLYEGAGDQSYKQLFKLANEQCDEMIFSLQCVDKEEYSHRKNRGFGNRCLPPDASGNGLGWNNYIINPQMAELYENSDGSKFNWDDYIPGYNEMGINARMVYFLRNNITETERANAVAAGADMSKYDPTGNEERIKKAYAHRDPRMAMSIITPYASFIGGVEGTPKEYVMRYPFRSYTTYGDLKTDTSLKFYYLNRKFVGEGLEFQNIYSELDLPLIRYADVLLNWAEALNELGDLQGAIDKVNEVRSRAGAQLLETNEYTHVTGKEDMHQRIMNERHIELLGEDVIFFDELRWKTWKDLKFFVNKEGKVNGMTQIWGTTTNNYVWGGDQYWLLPIPAREMQMNPNMTQNPGWE
ncbi:RagB/SusD family nutrient uptake outer membrane protein [Mediterranea massiliensis]|uniref:RagB/SusD family nutrient uptake outer membrane protein n=1 Tax=Mediterranea massiliensis TaxID=1841865 RepID=UPI0025A32C1E|nr:RagB/SusD family nutrient uptake outer membrane protein [Mediterranea massiliensis]MDM8339130.1 RagB/SusD family nutrient uptake outer membrane protein [Mediterranea massiliensis]